MLVDPKKFAASLCNDIRWEDDPRYIAAAREANDFQQRELPDDVKKLLLEQAQAKYDERRADFEQLDKKREGLITFSMGAITLLAAARQLGATNNQVVVQVAFAVSLCGFLAAVVLLLASRRVVRFPGRFTIQSLREGVSDDRIVPEDWLAASLHKSCEAIRVLEDIAAAHVNVAATLILLALTSLVPVAIIGTVPTNVGPAADLHVYVDQGWEAVAVALLAAVAGLGVG